MFIALLLGLQKRLVRCQIPRTRLHEPLVWRRKEHRPESLVARIESSLEVIDLEKPALEENVPLLGLRKLEPQESAYVCQVDLGPEQTEQKNTAQPLRLGQVVPGLNRVDLLIDLSNVLVLVVGQLSSFNRFLEVIRQQFVVLLGEDPLE